MTYLRIRGGSDDNGSVDTKEKHVVELEEFW
jgi:hypothetical protein